PLPGGSPVRRLEGDAKVLSSVDGSIASFWMLSGIAQSDDRFQRLDRLGDSRSRAPINPSEQISLDPPKRMHLAPTPLREALVRFPEDLREGAQLGRKPVSGFDVPGQPSCPFGTDKVE